MHKKPSLNMIFISHGFLWFTMEVETGTENNARSCNKLCRNWNETPSHTHINRSALTYFEFQMSNGGYTYNPRFRRT